MDCIRTKNIVRLRRERAKQLFARGKLKPACAYLVKKKKSNPTAGVSHA